jgi:mono/diheme cytochrome c family protein
MNTRALFRRLLIVFSCIGVLSCFCGVVASAVQGRAAKEQVEWKAPARASRKTNPIAADAASIKAGKVVYIAECVDCHGRRGAGDGPGARDLKSRVPALTNPDIWRQTDGALFWKLSTGRADMPGFEDMLSEEQRWHVLNYTRATFAPGGTTNENAGVAAGRQRPEGKP